MSSPVGTVKSVIFGEGAKILEEKQVPRKEYLESALAALKDKGSVKISYGLVDGKARLLLGNVQYEGVRSLEIMEIAKSNGLAVKASSDFYSAEQTLVGPYEKQISATTIYKV